HTERRKPGVTLELLHLEYLERHPDGYRYTQFCDIYRHWLRRRRLTMRQVHRGGEKGFVDYAGKTPSLTDPATGERIPVELFLMALGASSYTYAEATASQQLADWIASHTRAFAFYGGVPRAVVPDQLRSAVTIPCRYEPGIQRTYAELAAHYGTTILPARPAKPRDKAIAEVGVQVAERWIVARLRHETFYTLAALNERIAELLAALNAKPMRHYGGASRRELFERLERPHLRPLPAEPFEYAEWLTAGATVDYPLAARPHPEQGYRSCLGILRLAKRYTPRGSRRRVAGRSPPVPAPTGTWRRSSSAASIACRPAPHRPPPPSSTRISGAATTTTEGTADAPCPAENPQASVRRSGPPAPGAGRYGALMRSSSILAEGRPSC